MHQLAQLLRELKWGLTLTCYDNPDIEVPRKMIMDKLPPLLQFQGEKAFVGGETVTWIDFYFLDCIYLMKLISPDLFEQFPSLEGYFLRVTNLPNLKEYLQSPANWDNQMKFHNFYAKINF